MAHVHFTLQGKGGVGKSFVSSLLAQGLQSYNQSVKCLDTDPINSTLLSYQHLSVTPIHLMEQNRLNERCFDDMMECLLNPEESGYTYVIDNGASSFIALSNYLIENQAIDLLHDAGRTVFIHTVVTGGQGMMDTLHGLDALAKQLPETANLVVWLNSYFGPITMDGKSFEDMKVYLTHQSRIKGIVKLPTYNADTFGKDMAALLDKRLTFAEVGSHPEFSLMAKQRLTMISRQIFDQLHWLR